MRARSFALSAFSVLLALGLCELLLRGTLAQDAGWRAGLPKLPGSKWLVHDDLRPAPKVVTPGAHPGDPPSDAVVLFDGKDASKWTGGKWKVEDGYMEINSTGSITSTETFGDCQVHLEYTSPSPPKGSSQGRGNSGIFMMGRFEIQVLDSFDNWTYSDGSAASLYGQKPALFNACRKPGEWQVYDIVFRAPRFDAKGDVLEKAQATIFHNGVLVHHGSEFIGETAYRTVARYNSRETTGPISIQDHGDKQPVRFRNIWVRRLDLSPEPRE